MVRLCRDGGIEVYWSYMPSQELEHSIRRQRRWIKQVLRVEQSLSG